MRHPADLGYRIDTLPPVPPVLRFIQQQAALDDAEAYGTLNMGAGFALYLPAAQAARAVELARGCGVDAWVAGTVVPGPRRVEIVPLGVSYGAGELDIR
jgi:phosphoribosylformylglycinamidine cyclo-ligase